MSRNWLLGLSAVIVLSGSASAQSPVERGKYLVDTIMTCANCHSPKGPPQVTAGKDYSGGLRFDEPPFDVTAPNITPDKATGIGEYTDAELKTLLRKGINRHGIPIAVVMPTGFYEILTESDLDAIIAYLHTLKPVSNKVPDPIYKMQVPREVFPGAEKPMPASAMSNKVTRGFYLATIAHCMECHTPLGPTGADFKNHLGEGGREFPGPWGKSVSRNITSSKTKGIGDWTDAEIKRAITQGIRKDGTKLNPPMGYEYYAKVKDEDLDAVIAWLRTLPAKE